MLSVIIDEVNLSPAIGMAVSGCSRRAAVTAADVSRNRCGSPRWRPAPPRSMLDTYTP
jgi:hypothetical protein